MAYTDANAEEKAAVEQNTRDIRAWAGTLQKLVNDGKQLRIAYDDVIVPIMNVNGVQGSETIPNTSNLSGSNPNFTYTDLVTLVDYMDTSATSITGASGGDWDSAAKQTNYVKASGPLGG